MSLVDTSCGRLYVERPRPGQGRPLVLIHGFMMSHGYFGGLMQGLAAEHDVVAIDLPGFGDSDRPPPERFAYDLPAFAGAVAEVMEHLGLGPSAVLGHSMGGGVALTLGARHPERVERLVLMAAAVYPLPLPKIARVLLGPGGWLLWRYGITKGLMRELIHRDHIKDARAADDRFIDETFAHLRRAGGHQASYASLKMLGALGDHTADPGRVRAPTLLVWADEDRVVPLRLGRRLERAIAGARLTVVPDTGHLFLMERPDEVLRQIGPFLRDQTLEPMREAPVPPPRAQAWRERS